MKQNHACEIHIMYLNELKPSVRLRLIDATDNETRIGNWLIEHVLFIDMCI